MLFEPIFPFYDDNEKQINGEYIYVPEICIKCNHKICLGITDGKLKTCGNGLNYITINGIRCFGFIVYPFIAQNRAISKVYQSNKSNVIYKYLVVNYLYSINNKQKQLNRQIEEEKNQIINQYIKSKEYKNDFFINLKEEINKQMSFAHDYRQLNSSIIQNINILLAKKYGNSNIDIIIDKAEEYEKAIYYTAKLLDERLNATLFLIRPELLKRQEEYTTFRFHSLVWKLYRIYYPQFKKKDLHIHFHGQSEMNIYGNSGAISIIPQTFIDNAQKYAPIGSDINIFFEDKDDGVLFSVESWGPEILESEENSIFNFMFRGERAKKVSNGMGHGLFLSQYIATEHLGSLVNFSQDTTRKHKDNTYATRFYIFIPNRCKQSF